MIRELTGEEHERLWHICHDLLLRAGASAALLCDAASGALLISVGEAGAQGEPDEVRLIGPREHVVRGPAGHMYGLDMPGGVLLAVLHDEGGLPLVRKAAARAASEAGALLRGETKPRKGKGKKKGKAGVSPRLRRRARRR